MNKKVFIYGGIVLLVLILLGSFFYSYYSAEVIGRRASTGCTSGDSQCRGSQPGAACTKVNRAGETVTGTCTSWGNAGYCVSS